jgi:hypothetical protein
VHRTGYKLTLSLPILPGLTDYKSRLAAVEAIGALDAASLTREDKLRVAVVAIEALQTLLKKEGMDEVRVAAVMALGLWLSYTSKITPEAKQLYLAGALPHLQEGGALSLLYSPPRLQQASRTSRIRPDMPTSRALSWR